MCIRRSETMGHLTIYLGDADVRAVRTAARRARRSVSDWARERMLAGLKKDWPKGYFDVLGSVTDDSLVRPRQPAASDDGVRMDFGA
jgi:hypothetical protein